PGKAKAGKRPRVPPNEKLTGDIGLGGMKRPVKIGSPGISAMSNPPMTRLIVVSPNWNGTLKLAAPVKSVKIGGPEMLEFGGGVNVMVRSYSTRVGLTVIACA